MSYHPNKATACQVGDPSDGSRDPLRKNLNWNTGLDSLFHSCKDLGKKENL